jgi:hypothetical protein
MYLSLSFCIRIPISLENSNHVRGDIEKIDCREGSFGNTTRSHENCLENLGSLQSVLFYVFEKRFIIVFHVLIELCFVNILVFHLSNNNFIGNFVLMNL